MKYIITGVALLCFAVSNAYALGDGIHVNGLLIEPGITLTGKYNDNIALTETAPASSWFSIVKPDLDIRAGSDSRYMTVGYAFERGDDFSGNDSYSDHFADAALHYEASSRAVFDTDAKYTRSHDGRGTTFSGLVTGFNTPDRWHKTAANARFSYGRPDATGRVVVDGGYEAKRYLNHQSLTRARELNTSKAGVTFYYRIGAKTSALLEGRYAQYDYRLANSLLDSNEITTYAGITWEATAKTKGTVKAGWQRKKFDFGATPATSYLSWNAEIEWSPLSYSVWTLNSGFAASETDSSTGSFTKTNNVKLVWTHQWNKFFSHEARASYVHDKFVGATSRTDNTYTASISLNYSLKAWLDIGAAYDYAKRSSNTVNAGYRQNAFSVILKGVL